MASKRAAIRMSDAEVDAFLELERTLGVATNGPDGFPHVVPMWFDRFDGRIGFWTYASSQKAANLRRDPRLTCVAEAGESYDQLRGVMITGRAELVEDEGDVLAVGLAIHHRYTGVQPDEGAMIWLREQASKRVAVLVHERTVASWDHRKLAAAG